MIEHPGLSDAAFAITPCPSQRWRTLTPEHKKALMEDAINSRSSKIAFVRLGIGAEVIVTMEESASPGVDGAELMALEASLEEALGTAVELYCETTRDEVQSRVKREQVMDWVRRREESKKLGEQE